MGLGFLSGGVAIDCALHPTLKRERQGAGASSKRLSRSGRGFMFGGNLFHLILERQFLFLEGNFLELFFLAGEMDRGQLIESIIVAMMFLGQFSIMLIGSHQAFSQGCLLGWSAHGVIPPHQKDDETYLVILPRECCKTEAHSNTKGEGFQAPMGVG